MARPSETLASVVLAMASTAGVREYTFAMAVPIRRSVVVHAISVRSTNASVPQLSLVQTDSYPRDSRCSPHSPALFLNGLAMPSLAFGSLTPIVGWAIVGFGAWGL